MCRVGVDSGRDMPARRRRAGRVGGVASQDEDAMAQAGLALREALEGSERTRAPDAWIGPTHGPGSRNGPSKRRMFSRSACGLGSTAWTSSSPWRSRSHATRICSGRWPARASCAVQQRGHARLRLGQAFQRLPPDIQHDDRAAVGSPSGWQSRVGVAGCAAGAGRGARRAAAAGLLDLANLCTRPPSKLTDVERSKYRQPRFS